MTTLRELEPRGLELDPSDERRAGERTLTEAEVAALVPALRATLLGAGTFVYDPDCFYRAAPNRNEPYAWPEHPRGTWTSATNSDGAREDHELGARELDAFVLVAGDSQTEGMCDNADTFCTRLEAELATAGRPRIEVYDTGLSGYTFQNYVGVLRRHLDRAPAVFVTVFYGGNDFVEAVRLEHVLRREPQPPSPSGYDALLARAHAAAKSAFSQGVNQWLYFRAHPDEAAFAAAAARAACDEIAATCAERGIPWIAVYLPTPLELTRAPWRDLRARLRDELGLADEDERRIADLVDGLLASARERGATVVDLRPVLSVAEQRCFWSELHLDLDGHALVAKTLAPELLRALEHRTATEDAARDEHGGLAR
ncbi:MAG: hypothetical protein IT453_07425 [Planctomycetes bacterium]|nr:hypothetical protein [Planctomycetota bacterium]